MTARNGAGATTTISGGASYRWVMLGLIWCCYFAFGTVSTSIAPLVSPIMGDLNLGATEMGFVLGAWQLTYIGVAFWCGAIMDQIGLKWALTAGMVCLTASAICRSFAVDFLSLTLAVALFGVGGPMISVGSPKLVALWFDSRQRGGAIGVSSTGPTVGTVAMLALANSVLVPLAGGWRGAVLIPGLVVVVMTLAWIMFAREAPAASAANRTTDGPPTPTPRSNPVQTMRELMRVRNVQVLMFGAGATFAVGHGLSNWLPRILQSKSLSAEEAGFFAAAATLAGIVSTLLVPRIAGPGRRRHLLTVIFAGQCATLIALITLSGYEVLYALPWFGFFQRAINPLVLLILMDTPEVGSKHMGSIGGLYFALAEMGGFLGPLIVGWLFDLTGAFVASLLFLVALTVFLTGLSRWLNEGAVSTPIAATANQPR